MRETLIGGTSDDRPALMGFENATDLTDGVPTDGPFLTYQLGQSAAGGGVSVANDGRVTVVGRTNPVGGLFPVEGLNARAEDSGMDAVRTDVDMVPQSITAVGGALPGVARTDGTGFQGAGATFPIAGFTGGTTPECGLSPYGRRIGEPEPAVARMLIDYEGTAPALGVTDAAIVISRPATVSGSITMGVLWLGFPAAAGPTSVVDGVEFWADPASWVFLIDVWSEERAYRMPLNPFGPNPGTMSVQLHCLLDATPGSGPLGFTRVTHGPGCASEFVASPALWLSF